MFNTNTKIRITGLKDAVAMIDHFNYVYIFFNTRLMHVWVDRIDGGNVGYQNHYLENRNNIMIDRQDLERVSASVGSNMGTRKELESILLSIILKLRSIPNRPQIGLSDNVKESQINAAVKTIDSLREFNDEYWGYFDLVTYELLVEKSSMFYSLRYPSSVRMKLFTKREIKQVALTLWRGATLETVLKELINLFGN